jgi:predicted amidohydrolase YtcJ
LIVHNGTIYTLSDETPKIQAMAIRDGKIVETGPEHQIRNKYSTKEYLDLRKGIVAPSFF